MSGAVLIVGQGLAGTVLGWELERAGIEFRIADAGHERAASRVAAGIINPVTGQRLVKNRGFESLMPVARECYRALERELGVPLWRDLRVRRFFADERERRVWAEKRATGELSPYAGEADEAGFWVEGAARVDLPALIAAARERWRRAGVLQEERVTIAAARTRHAVTIDCTGAQAGGFGFVPWRYSKGECLTIEAEGLEPDVVLNRRQWVLPLEAGQAMTGATHEPGRRDAEITAEGRRELEGGLAQMGVSRYQVIGQEAGVRVYSPDKLPVIGRDPETRELGLINALGAKGALHAPALAKQWVAHLRGGTAFGAGTDVARYWTAGR